MYRQFNPNLAGKYLDEHQYKPYIPKKKNPS